MEPEDVLYNLHKNQIDQLHNATLNMSKQCFEIKKLCLTIELTILTFTFNFTTDTKNGYLYIAFLGLIIPFVFLILDSLTYYYQDALRSRMIVMENKIRDKYILNPIDNKHNRDTLTRLCHSVLNLSQSLYYILIIADVIFIYIYI